MCTRQGAPAPMNAASNPTVAAAAAPAAQQQAATPTGLAAAQDFDAIAQHMADKHGIAVSPRLMQTVAVDTLRTACEGIEAVINEFPAVKAYVNTLSDGATGSSIAQVNPAGDIQINTSTYRTTGSLNATVQKNLRLKHHPAGTGGKEFTSHEVGHMLGLMLCEATVRAEIAKQVLAGQPAPGRHAIRMAVIADWNNNTTSDKFIARAVKNINQRAKRAGHSQTTQAALISHVSGYAQTDTGEALAECVADYVANGQNARRLSREVWRLLKKELT